MILSFVYSFSTSIFFRVHCFKKLESPKWFFSSLKFVAKIDQKKPIFFAILSLSLLSFKKREREKEMASVTGVSAGLNEKFAGLGQSWIEAVEADGRVKLSVTEAARKAWKEEGAQ